MEEAEGRIGELEDKINEKEEAKKKRDKKTQDHEGGIWELSDSIKWNNIHIIGIPDEEEREKGAEGVLEQIIAENFPDLGGKKQALKSKRYREIPSDVTWINLLQDLS